jgi:glycosyltransferase involved in cell wall biosynthesis
VTLPTVSVLLPVRDGARHLPEALASLRAQTLTDFELILVDDGSRDDSAAVAEVHGVRGLRQGPEGRVAAREGGRAAARGRFVARMDADDVALPERLELQVAATSGSTACPSSRSTRRRATPRRSGSAPWPGRCRASASEDSSRLGVGRKGRASSQSLDVVVSEC